MKQANVTFNEEQHLYTNSQQQQLTSVTTLIRKHIFPDQYADVDEEVLQKAAERGTMIHRKCELYDDLELDDKECQELQNYKFMTKTINLEYVISEMLVSDEVQVAGSIDKVFKHSYSNDYVLGDIKTTAKLDKYYLSWQLSLYAYLFEKQTGYNVVGLYGFWMKNDKSELTVIERIPNSEVEKLLAADAKGDKYQSPYEVVEELPSTFKSDEELLLEAEENIRYYTDLKKDITERIYSSMENFSARKWLGKSFTLTRVDSSSSEVFDKAAFKKDHPEEYRKYIRKSTRKGFLKLTTANKAI